MVAPPPLPKALARSGRKKPPPLAARKTRPANGKLEPQHEAFCQAIANGMNACQAYRAHVGGEGVKTSTCMSEGSKLLCRPIVRARVNYLADRVEQRATERFALSKEKHIAFLQSVIDTPLDEIDASHQLAHKSTPGKFGTTVESFPKPEAAKQLAQILGWNAAEKVKVEHNIAPAVDEALDKMFA